MSGNNNVMHAEEISKRIQELLNDINITPNRLSVLAGLTPSTVNSIYTGRSKNPTIKTIYEICKALDISLVDFFDFPPYNEKESEKEQDPKELMVYLKKLSKEIENIEKKLNGN